ncbi:MAG: hypothetical protein F6K28_06720 [Microcoleus sp. SIO2G3]|nr:hypothetical protein [Microcoleus sp. SIO2G3]
MLKLDLCIFVLDAVFIAVEAVQAIAKRALCAIAMRRHCAERDRSLV